MNLQERVVHVFYAIRPGGGPSGYLYNLRSGVGADHPLVRVVCPTESEDRYFDGSRATGLKVKIGQLMPRTVAARLFLQRQIWDWNQPLDFEAAVLDAITSARVVVFHNPVLARRYLVNGGRRSGQKVYVMPHGPTDFAAETVQSRIFQYGETAFWQQARIRLAKLELETYQLADGILAPCRQALDGYFDFDPQMQAVLRQVSVYELPSGVAAMQAKRSRSEVLNALGISPDKQIVGYFGRYHPHKGFDYFCEVVKEAARRGDERFMFISAGAGAILPPTDLPNYKDLGWQKEGLPDLIAAANLVLSPNRYTYFDLMILEAMSLGRPILTSANGGNLYLQEHCVGVTCFTDPSPSALYESLVALSPATLQEMSRASQSVFDRSYNLQAFCERHINFARSLVPQPMGSGVGEGR
jgi:glycosyltransferase involved in cell wall biosynthesis